MNNLIAKWPAPKNISALTTTRLYGCSSHPYHHNNLAMHVGDDENHVLANRHALRVNLALPGEPAWLEQTHSNHCVMIDNDDNRKADASITRNKTTPLVIMTADCVPIVLCDKQGSEIAAIHAGWRGLMHGIIKNTIESMHHEPQELLAWVGPAICKSCYEVGPEVRDTFTQHFPESHKAFRPQQDRFYADLAFIAESMLRTQGVEAIYHSEACTYESEEIFFSYRRAAQTGRMATLIWFNS